MKVKLKNTTQTFVDVFLNGGTRMVINAGETTEWIDEQDISYEMRTLMHRRILVQIEKQFDEPPADEGEEKEVIRKVEKRKRGYND